MTRVYILEAEGWRPLAQKDIPEEEHFTSRKIPLKELKELIVGLYEERFAESVVVLQDLVGYEEIKEDRDALIAGVVEGYLIKKIERALGERIVSINRFVRGKNVYAFANVYHLDTLRMFNETLGFPRTYVKVVEENLKNREKTVAVYGVLDLIKLKPEFKDYIEIGKIYAIKELVKEDKVSKVYAMESDIPSMEAKGREVKIIEPFTPASLGFSLKHGWGILSYL